MLLALCLLVWGERCVPGRENAVETLGEDGFLRFVVGALCLLVYVLWLNQQRLLDSFTRLLKLFKDVQEERVRGADGSDAAKRLEAVRLLIASLGTGDADLRAKSRAHLQRLTGQDLGEDPHAWQAWLEQQGTRTQGGGTAESGGSVK